IAILIAIILFTGISIGNSQSLEDKKNTLDKYLSQFSKDEPGAELVIAKNGEIIYSNLFGYSNLQTHSKINRQTVFEAGSVSKQFTAAAILLLAQEGKLSLSDKVRKYVPELPKYRWPITIKNLLSQTS